MNAIAQRERLIAVERAKVDVVVVGGGGAGLSAAAEAAALGRKVLLLEKNARLGGTSRMSVGSLMAAGTRLQREAGIEDSADRHYEELEAIVHRGGFGDNRALRRLLVDNAAATVDLMERIGVDFIGPLSQPPFPTKRFYQALPGGHVYVTRLEAHCRRLGVEIRLRSAVERLTIEDGRVTGVEWREGDGRPARVAARHGVVLASGDMSGSREMRREIWGPDLDPLEPINPTSTGDGQRLGLSAGGTLVTRPDLVPHGVPRFVLPAGTALADRLPTWRIVTRFMRLALRHLPSFVIRPFIMRAAMTALAPERAMYEDGAVMVNRSGDRFTDELGRIGPAIALQEGGEAFAVFDGAIADRYACWPHFVSTAPGVAYAYVDDFRRARPDIFHEAPTIEGLAGKLGCAPARLRRSLESRNARPLLPPFVAMGPLRTWLLLTPAGLAVNDRLEVLDASDRPIPGLYAAGGTGQGGLSFTHYYHGHSLCWALTSGRLAGKAASEAQPAS